MNRAALKLVLLQVRKMIDLILAHWDDAAGEDVKVDGVVDEDVVRQERLRDELRRRGVRV